MAKFIFYIAREMLNSPMRVFWLCLTFIVVGLSVDGTWMRWWRLNQELVEVSEKMQVLSSDKARLQVALKESLDPNYLERQARDHFDLVHEGDLLFIFSND